MPRRRGFTLVELLVAIGIIALLISILIPAVGNAREQANTVRCLANLRSIMQAASAYSAENGGVVLPGKTLKSGLWANILVEGKYLAAPVVTAAEAAAGRNPVSDGNVFFCPSGNMDLAPPNPDGNAQAPASRTDVTGAMCYRSQFFATGNYLDIWYGINADGDITDSWGKNVQIGAPVRCIEAPAGGAGTYVRIANIRQPSEMVMLYDGLYWHQMVTNANRLNARHGRRKLTNLAFFDGHAETWSTANLPGGGGVAAVTAFSAANLNANFRTGPKWRFDQK